jgi:hypothetical protein
MALGLNVERCAMSDTSDEEDFEIRPDRRNFVLKVVLIGSIVVVAIGMGSMIVLALLFPWAVARRERAQREKLKQNLRQIGIALHNYEQTHRQPPTSTTDDGVSPDKE